MLPKDHDGVLITGKRKRGKSTLLAQFLRNETRVLLYDAKGELREPTQIYSGQVVSLPKRGVMRAFVRRGPRPSEELEWAAYSAIILSRCIFVVDELPDALEDADPGESFKWVTRMGRMRDIRFVYSFQRPTEIPAMARTNAADWYLSQTNEDTDLEWVRKSVSKDAREMVRTLKTGEFLHVKDGEVIAIMRSYDPRTL